MKCARCGIKIGKSFIEGEYKIKKFKGEDYVMCSKCYKQVGSVQTIQDLPKGDLKKKDYKPWWKGGAFE